MLRNEGDRMRTDNTLRCDAIKLLVEKFGEVEAERFIFLIKKEQFNYTKWQRNLWNDLTIDEIFKLAADREKARKQE